MADIPAGGPGPGIILSAAKIFRGIAERTGSGRTVKTVILEAAGDVTKIEAARDAYEKGTRRVKGLARIVVGANIDALNRAIADIKSRVVQPTPTRTNPRPALPPVRPGPVISAPTAGSPPPAIPSQVGEIFRGTTVGKAAGAAKRVGEKAIKGGARGGVVGTAIIGGIEGARIILQTAQDQKDLESKIYKDQTKAQERADNKRVDEIRRKQREEDQRIAREEKERDRAAAMARTKARIEARRQEVAGRKQERELAREANNRAQAKIEEQKQLDREEAKISAAQAKAAKAGRAALIKKVQTYASLAGLLYSLKGRSKRSGGRSQNIVEPINPPVIDRPRRTIPTRPDFSFRPAEPTFGTDFGSIDFSTQFAASKTTVATKTKVAKCRSDTPKRKKGRCRTGFFRETPNKTTYKTWSERKCL